MLIASKLVGLLLLPPGILVLLALVGLVMQLRWPRLGALIIATAFVALLALSLPVTGQALLAGLEDEVAPVPPANHGAQAIVVLGGGRHRAAPEYAGDTINAATLERLRYAVRLQRATKLPILVTGGIPLDETTPEAELMRRSLEQDFAIGAKWVEGQARNTHENAIYSKALLDAAGVRRVLLVTHAWHMPRALRSFRQAGLDVVPAPTAFGSTDRLRGPFDYFPSSRGLNQSSLALHEYLGLLWYRWRYPAPSDTAAADTAPNASSLPTPPWSGSAAPAPHR